MNAFNQMETNEEWKKQNTNAALVIVYGQGNITTTTPGKKKYIGQSVWCILDIYLQLIDRRLEAPLLVACMNNNQTNRLVYVTIMLRGKNSKQSDK